MIHEKYKFIRIHIKKTGGRSLWHLFPEPDDSHAHFGEYMARLGPAIKDYFIWTIVRNPWDRMVSLFFYELLETQKCHTSDFKQFVADVHNARFNHGPSCHFYDALSQMSYLTDHSGNLAMDYVAFLPNISEDFEMIKKRLGLPEDMRYPHTGANPHEDYRSYYDEKSINLVSEMFQQEIDFFCFEFENKNSFKYPIEDCVSVPFQESWRQIIQE
jgi:hypothetical protein